MSSEKVELFMVGVTIIEGRHLAWPNMDSAVHVRVDNQRKCTAIRYSTDSPFFNEYFAFEFSTTLQTLMDKTITLTVIQPRKVCRSKKILGYVTLDMATVWAQPEHQFYHKWAVIAAPINDPAGGPKGYVKVDINILRKGESPKIPNTDPQETDEIEGNLLLPEGMATERQRANYVFKIYRGENLCRGKYLESKTAAPPDKDPPSTFIEVFFAGLKAKTSTKKNTLNPVWNESLVLTELFPPLCQRIKIHLCCTDSFLDTTFAVRHINLRSISNDGEHGFLPTFGPTFVHFYAKGSSNEGYVGKILMSFSTDIRINTISMAKSERVEQILALPEVNLWKNDPVLLYGIIFNAHLIDKKYSDKPISYEINFGNSELQKRVHGSGDGKVSYGTSAIEPLSKEKFYWYLEYGQDKPCVFVLGIWPDFRKRLYNSNMIGKILEELKLRLDKIEALFINEEFKFPSRGIENLLLETIDFLSSACRKYIDIAQVKSGNPENELDRERGKLCLREIGDIENATREIYNPRTKKKCFRKLQDLFGRLELLVEDAQDCWPDVYVTMVSGSKKVAFCRCPVRNIVYSVVDEEKGKYCGEIQNLFLQATSKKPNYGLSCKMDMFLWVGLERHKKACFEAFPKGFKPPGDCSPDSFPPYLVAQEKHYFQCRAHVYQGKFLPGSDKSGLCDPFARVIIESDCQQTAVSPATLNPLWDQTLIYRKLIIYGTKQHIKANPPLIVMEVFDQDECCKTEFVGRCTFKPVIKFSDQPYTAPNFPPKLHWYNICKSEEVLGEVLAVAEFLETSEKTDETDFKPSNEVVRIPSDIKPSVVLYFMEVIFWGVRELQKIQLLPVTKPKVTIECGPVILHSDTILSVNKSLNFTQANKQIEVSLPEQEEYAPPICIKLFDCRSFGRYTLAGTHIISINNFLYHPLTMEQRNRKLLESGRETLESRKSKHVCLSMMGSDNESKESSTSKSSNTTPRKSRCKQWLKRIFGPKKKSDSTNKKIKKKKSKFDTTEQGTNACSEHLECYCKPNKRTRKTNKTDGDTTEEEVEAQRRCRCDSKSKKNKREKSDTSDGNTTSGDACDKKPCTHRSKKRRKEKKKAKKEKSESDESSSSGGTGKSRSKSRSKTRENTTEEETKTRRSRSKSKSKRKTEKPKKGSHVSTATTDEERDVQKIYGKRKSCKRKKTRRKQKKYKTTDEDSTDTSTNRKSCWMRVCRKKKKKQKVVDEIIHPDDYDWWTKYYASIEGGTTLNPKKTGFTLKMYLNELEAQPEFEGFTDTLHTFQMYKGKRTGDETVDEANITGIFKGAIRIYRWPPPNNLDYVTETGMPLNKGAFQNFLSNELIRFVVRIYCVKGINLRPKDVSGRSDPYIVVKMGGKVINDRKNYVSKQINPIFGRCFELNGVFPLDHAVTIAVWDMDLTTSDDLIGETKIDIENRFFTRHRGHCGIASEYQEIGYCWWRDQERPSRILENLCRKNNIDPPEYTENCVRILLQEFYPAGIEGLSKKARNRMSFDKEALALCALHRWQEVPLVGCYLVPEHIESRSLYHPAKPGVEQGKLQVWIDIFLSTDLPPPPQVNISPRKPVDYELRVIIWNTDNVILEEDDFFVGEKMSDIYVKGWLTGPEESQCTDVHYRSMTGEGSFNWRFIFRFRYLPTENKLVVTKKESLFSVDETEFKLPCRLTLQVWDNDTFSANDFLGIVVLELARLPRGARSAKTCTLNNLASGAPTINLFKTKRTKGWWPFRGVDEETKAAILAGKVEAELELITVEEAEKSPVGLARAEPQPLPKPKRPDTAFSWFRNPLKALKFLICKHYRWKIIKCFLLIFIVFGIGVTIYSFPGYSVKKLLQV